LLPYNNRTNCYENRNSIYSRHEIFDTYLETIDICNGDGNKEPLRIRKFDKNETAKVFPSINDTITIQID